jgi:hypothetical protein
MMPFPSPRLPFAANLWLAARLLPFFANARLDRILARATPGPALHAYGHLSAADIVKAVKRAGRRPIRMRDRRCLREGLLGFHYLSLAGHRPVLHFGLQPRTLAGGRPQAHCWITLAGISVLNPAPPGMIELFAYDGRSPADGATAPAAIATARYD